MVGIPRWVRLELNMSAAGRKRGSLWERGGMHMGCVPHLVCGTVTAS